MYASLQNNILMLDRIEYLEAEMQRLKLSCAASTHFADVCEDLRAHVRLLCLHSLFFHILL